ncbi:MULTISPECIES: NUDIX hydrolase [Alkalihalophilus]|uniref:8-oxo-dGTP diphosphatase n=2 Tax=Alkalihalophilus TaxID=2893060 RepID=A0AAJ2NPM1_ALKPS|nr:MULTISPECIES: 8-oxo-dGTP diphosphatase [Alkalihalophilus]MDV2886224.1 8-oxo-dGTP diphosphatase [Alkalihalophilus pseudofirmus]MEC2071210.1 8-oxo-dGTP diphosphatase [Alkalihalophilus marmarensis]MED1603138.1 8-oxo-dGTP diphosphatase [Alkalihalophilus marmarensis]WEG19140.1 8-oxo-dGTP diphosphatase [Alkalihalophilus pseudofirmus]
MQRVTNCVLVNGDQALLLQKPRRGWWVAPGGKMESGESIKEAVTREFREETGFLVKDAKLRAVFSMVIIEDDKIQSEWMMFTFQATQYEGEQLEESPEGSLKWQPLDQITSLPMAEGDKQLFRHVLEHDGLMYGTFHYTPDFKLLSYRLDPDPSDPDQSK